ncbi:putative carotenoid 9,10(9',10')-cleavage dioxygenase 1-like [Capsicum annuum]|nr:putative carotenoid 9,10(9',10')-cleavage dioxygenase 1-like [Capsicum annuum]
MEEILMDILSRLSVKSLLRFKCVSKFWKTLISQPYFKKKHLNHAKNQLSSQQFLFARWDTDCHFLSSTLPLVELVKDIRIFDCSSNSNGAVGRKVCCSCDGLFLIGIWSEPHVKQPSILVIWNPSTKESIALPHSEFPLDVDDDDSTYYHGNDSVGSAYGLAYDSINDDYKIFRIDMYASYEIFSLKTGSWRIIDETSAGRTNSFMLSGGEYLAFVHGGKFCLVSFNISNEMFREMPLPEIVCSQIHFKIVIDVDVGVSVLRGTLAVYYKNEKAFDLWLMKNYGIKDSWMKLFTIPSVGFIVMKRIISGGSFGLSDRMWPLDYDDIGAANIDEDDFAYTESPISPKLGH